METRQDEYRTETAVGGPAHSQFDVLRDAFSSLLQLHPVVPHEFIESTADAFRADWEAVAGDVRTECDMLFRADEAATEKVRRMLLEGIRLSRPDMDLGRVRRAVRHLVRPEDPARLIVVFDTAHQGRLEDDLQGAMDDPHHAVPPEHQMASGSWHHHTPIPDPGGDSVVIESVKYSSPDE